MTQQPVQQLWAQQLSFMKQSVLLAAVRGPDGIRKHHPVKVLMRWYRRSLLISAFDKKALNSPFTLGGGNFTGPFTAEHAQDIMGETPQTETELKDCFDRQRKVYIDHIDELPLHFNQHFMEAIHIMGCFHEDPEIRAWWKEFYLMLVKQARLHPESDADMDARLSDNFDKWQAKEVEKAA